MGPSKRRPGPAGELAKRVVDLYFAALGLLLLSPLLLWIAFRIKWRDGGAVFYRGVRVGRRGRPFRIFKFRTMRPDADKIGGSSTPEDDPRITPVGRFLRRTKIDELPQLLNVLRGEMSLVGPRPQVPWAVALYTLEERKILSVRPGITDEASIRFRHEGEILKGSPDPDRTYLEKIAPEKTRLQLAYARSRGLWTDLRLILRTIGAVVGLDDGGAGFESITEQWGMPASPEQLSMAYTRYRLAARHADGRRTLEVACGAGMGLGYLASRASRLVAGDYAWPNVREARSRVPGVPLLRLDAQRLPFRDGSFDVLLLFEALYYLPRQDRFLDECRRVLSRGGKVLLCLPNRERPGFLPSPFSTQYPTAAELRSLFDGAGFDAEIFGAYRIAPGGLRDAAASALRSLAGSLGLIPKTLAGRARIKRLLHRGGMKTLGAVADGMAPEEPLVPLGPGEDLRTFKNLYTVGSAR